MSISRRKFLLSTAGAAVGAILPSFYFRALEFFEQFDEPLLEQPALVTEDLIVADINGYPELSLGDPYGEEPPTSLTFREYFNRFEPGGIDTFQEHWGLGPERLDTLIDDDWVAERWMHTESPAARAYHYLRSLDLGKTLRGPDAVGGLDFLKESNMSWTWLAVRPYDMVTLSLLQRRLNDLGTGIRVVTGYPF